jgi:hypothetical protein
MSDQNELLREAAKTSLCVLSALPLPCLHPNMIKDVNFARSLIREALSFTRLNIAEVKDDAYKIFDAANADQSVRDVIEWYHSSLLAMTAQNWQIKALPVECYPENEKAFHAFWYAHMIDDLMQPPLAGIGIAAARYIWDAAKSHPTLDKHNVTNHVPEIGFGEIPPATQASNPVA